MKTLMLIFTLLFSPAAFAQQPRFHVQLQPKQPHVQVTVGMVRIHTHAANMRIAVLPLLAPLPYSYPRTTQAIPNALVLTGTELPYRPHERPRPAVTARQE
ncbi:MAG TPA: hypothetical protein VKH35_11675 [Thermoanaerobaculia bacterium]|nr:hypothetical protein [Thermoanaerobaculia bacterium]